MSAGRAYIPLQPVTWAASSDTGGNLDLRQIPQRIGGLPVYLVALIFRLRSFTYTLTGANANSRISLQRLIRLVDFSIPGVNPQPARISGDGLVRLYRVMTGGKLPPFAAASVSKAQGLQSTSDIAGTIAGTAYTISRMDLPLYFSDPRGRDPEDCAIPVDLLQTANLRVDFGAANDAVVVAAGNAGTVGGTASFEVIAVVEPRPERVIPAMPVVTEEAYQGLEPVISAFPGRRTHALLCPPAPTATGTGGRWSATTDVNTLGLQNGEQVVNRDGARVENLYDKYNMESADGEACEFTAHVDSTDDLTVGIPLQFPDDQRKGASLLRDAWDGRRKLRIAMNANGLTNAASRLLYRGTLYQGPWSEVARQAEGIPADAAAKPATASGKGLPAGADLDAASLPIKAIAG